MGLLQRSEGFLDLSRDHLQGTGLPVPIVEYCREQACLFLHRRETVTRRWLCETSHLTILYSLFPVPCSKLLSLRAKRSNLNCYLKKSLSSIGSHGLHARILNCFTLEEYCAKEVCNDKVGLVSCGRGQAPSLQKPAPRHPDRNIAVGNAVKMLRAQRAVLVPFRKQFWDALMRKGSSPFPTKTLSLRVENWACLFLYKARP